MVINHHISNVMVPIGLRAAFHGLIGLESSFEAFPENHGLYIYRVNIEVLLLILLENIKSPLLG